MKPSLVDRLQAAKSAPVESMAQLRLLISQKVDLDLHLPGALAILAKNPLIEVEYFAGDLLKAVLSVDREYWITHSEEWHEVHGILHDIDAALSNLHDARASFTAMK